MKLFRIAVVAIVFAVAGCSEYGFSRSVFQGKVVDRSAEEIESSIGKPDKVDKLSNGEVIYTYNKRTFDSENMNGKDASVKITLKKDLKTDKLAYSSIDFVAQ